MLESDYIKKLDSRSHINEHHLDLLNENYPGDRDKVLLLILLLDKDSTDAFKNVIRISSFRNVFIQKSGLFQAKAIKEDLRERYIALIPDGILPEEADKLYEYPISINDALANKLIKREILPTRNFFDKLCISFSSHPDFFTKNIIKSFLRLPDFPWKEYMMFPETAGKRDVIDRLRVTDGKAHFLLASWILSDEEKIKLVKSVNGKFLLFNIADNMDMPDGWESEIPREYLSALIRRDTGI